ncbi:glycosyltransferase family 4 protein [Brachybacterium sp. p3-SID1565]|uniref:glycosyltransferase family 4 protein n=1 Tax=Brachybacterium sp. p3-SID1565 TaxID=2916046 RepID=UPI0021A97198|nr:glycosyltransferase family 4 protein [Brachybacterium sp. p3-SID1565]MCT1384733.1 glycosyltransferase family 4 protein [Brachybacterium sp. p3-SID1565]
MRILLITHYYAPEFGAPQRRWSALIQRFVDAGHQVTVAAPVPHYPGGRPTPQQRRAHRVGAVERGDHGETVLRTAYLPHRSDIGTRTADHAVAAADSLRRLLCRFARTSTRPDVVIATAPAVPSLLVGRMLALRWRVPLVAEMRDAWPDLVTHVGPAGAVPVKLAPHTRPDPLRRAVGLAIGRAKGAVHHAVTSWQQGAQVVVTTTARFAEVLRERGIDDPRVVRNGTDLAGVRAQLDHPRGHHRELRCLYLGNMGRSQGLETVVRAAARLRARGVPVQVRMIGHGVEAPALAALAHELGAPVQVLSRIPHTEVQEQYAWADTVVVSLRDWEPFAWTVPSKLYELLATRRHITALLDGEAADVVREAGAGDVLAPQDEDALVTLWSRLAADRSLAAGRDSGRDWVAAHADDDVLAARYLGILEQVVAAGRGASGAPARP